ncbi:hypothetical protein [Nocardia amamiensis]|uniref:hypothetical protein n=1 Tax=Nocardia amamiensis TaxID=404578 RepID=UPI0008306954|nr:hypothetical protein [Nocardia amamiensis]
MGGPAWYGEDDAYDAVTEAVAAVDRIGQLRGILDAFHSNRAEDDFSSQGPYAQEDFECKQHGKRRKIEVSFVELTDTITVHGLETEVLGNTITSYFLALLDARNREDRRPARQRRDTQDRDCPAPRLRQPQRHLQNGSSRFVATPRATSMPETS